MNDQVRVWVSCRKCRGKRRYHLRWIDPATNRWRSRSAGTDKTACTDRKRAERAAAVLEDQLNAGTYTDLRRVSWADFIKEHIAKMDRAVATVKDTKRTLDEFSTVCTPVGPHRVDFRMIEAYAEHLRGKGNALATRNKRLRYIRAALNMAVIRGYLRTNPMKPWKWVRQEVKVPRVLNADEKTKLLAACRTEQWKAFVLVALATGCRRGELLSLTWDRVDFDNTCLTVTATKAHRDRVQPLNPETVAVLRALQGATLKDGGPFIGMQATNVANRFKAIVDGSGIRHCTIHDLRKTFCTDLARLGVNQLVVQRLAGHASGTTTATYYQFVDDATKRDAVAMLSKGTA